MSNLKLLFALVAILVCQANAAHEAPYEQAVASLNAEGINNSDDVKESVSSTSSGLVSYTGHGLPWRHFAPQYRKIFVDASCIAEEDQDTQSATRRILSEKEEPTMVEAGSDIQVADVLGRGSRTLLGRRKKDPVKDRNYLSAKQGNSPKVDTWTKSEASLWWFQDCEFTNTGKEEEESTSRRILGSSRRRRTAEIIQCTVQRWDTAIPDWQEYKKLSNSRGGIKLGNGGVDSNNSWRMWRARGGSSSCKLVDNVEVCPFYIASVRTFKKTEEFLTANSQGQGQVSLDKNKQCLNRWFISTKMWYSATYAARQKYCVKYRGAEGCEAQCSVPSCGNCLDVETTNNVETRQCECFCCDRLKEFLATNTDPYDNSCRVT